MTMLIHHNKGFAIYSYYVLFGWFWSGEYSSTPGYPKVNITESATKNSISSFEEGVAFMRNHKEVKSLFTYVSIEELITANPELFV